jgi:DNA polymerase-3 subunit epsilon
MRQIVLDTETTGLEPAEDHRIIEIGCVELTNRRITKHTFHQYLWPERDIDAGALEVHGISNEFLQGKPRFAEVVEEFVDFVRGAELVIHNAPFDIAFLNAELRRIDGGWENIEQYCTILDTLPLARELHPGQRNSLDALCRRYAVDNTGRELHGALLDAELLADVYLAMTGGQTALSFDAQSESGRVAGNAQITRGDDRQALKIILPKADEIEADAARLATINDVSGGKCIGLTGGS